MADLLGTALSVGNGLSSGSQSTSDLLIESFRRTKQPDIDALQTKKSTLENRQIFLNKFRTQLETLTAKADTFFATDAASTFNTKKVTVSDSSVLTATASGSAVTGIGTVKVDRLATNDILVSSRKNLSDAYVYAGTTKSITINSVTSDVTFDSTDTNETAFAKIAAAVNANSSSTVSASVIKDTSSTLRLTFTSKTTGATNQVNFTDGEILADAGISAAALNPNTATRTQSTATGAGFRLGNVNDLDAQIQINGIQVTRDKNTFSDVLEGITLTLQKIQSADDSPVTLTTAVDTDTLAGSIIQPFLDTFNNTLRYLKQDPATLRSDSSIRSVYSKLRSLVSEPITTSGDGNPKYLTDIGIKIGADGILTVSDKTTLQSFLESNPLKISNLFTTADGFAAKTKSALSTLIGSDGLISTRSSSLQSQITQVSNRKAVLQKRVDTQANSLRKEYEKMQQNYLTAQNQFSLLSGFPTTTTQ